MENKVEHILKELNISEDILNVYQYGSRVYGINDKDSDSDYIIVTKSGMLKSGGFKQNAISNKDRTIQGVLYSRSGFIDAINNYDISALECLSLPEHNILQKKWDFKVQKWDNKEFVKKIITKMSASWFSADNYAKDGYIDYAKKGVYHAIRILLFAKQLKEHQKITDFSVGNEFKEKIKGLEDFDTRDYIKMRDELVKELKE